MGKPAETDKAGDSAELEALFDSVSANVFGSVVSADADKGADDGDTNELQSLFDSVAEQTTSVPAADETPQERVFHRLGQMARQLHDTLRELGYDKMLESTAKQIPDARQRLTYIAQMTEQAASRVLNATDAAKPLQDQMLEDTEQLASRWEKVYANQSSVEEFKQLAAATRDYFRSAPDKHRATNDHLMEIMMAQDFQDLTGQVIKRVVEMAQHLETSLLGVLIDAIPPGHPKSDEGSEGLLNGPVMDASGRNDVVSSQSQVDDLLESLGF